MDNIVFVPGKFLSTLSLRRATFASAGRLQIVHNFYPRSPCGERPVQIVIVVVQPLFLSTLSLRRATRVLECTYNAHVNFYPRSPCGERRELV